MESFLDRLASAEPTPGGGGGAAAIGAIGVALLSMAARSTLAKRNDDARRDELQSQLRASEALRERLAALVAADARAYEGFMNACRLPSADEPSALARTAAMQAGLRDAIRVPLECAGACVEGLRLARRCVETAHRNVSGDAAAGALALLSAVRICELNVMINAHALRDAAGADGARAAARALLGEAQPLAEESRNHALRRADE